MAAAEISTAIAVAGRKPAPINYAHAWAEEHIMIEYRVRPVTRFVITRYQQEGKSGGVETFGLFENEDQSNRIATLLAEAEGAVFLQDEPEVPESPI